MSLARFDRSDRFSNRSAVVTQNQAEHRILRRKLPSGSPRIVSSIRSGFLASRLYMN